MSNVTIYVIILLFSLSFLVFGNEGDSDAEELITNKLIVNHSISEDNSSTIHTSNQFKASGTPSFLPEEFKEISVDRKTKDEMQKSLDFRLKEK